ncbi:hypothetical protein CYMTET_24276 [Cymbomonas tetramitiformis]|uniref:Ubiquitin-like domain-containing protein n=1 Tax=Cymbomonas tetramitiformis TaxID=36881 RepID=A0AAE0L0E3_9CHLO|nr:hypothetical protein CYMTET_24276 [Cymbomonas tetramitiformis]
MRIAALSSVTSLSLANGNRIRTVRPLAPLSRLAELDLIGCYNLWEEDLPEDLALFPALSTVLLCPDDDGDEEDSFWHHSGRRFPTLPPPPLSSLPPPPPLSPLPLPTSLCPMRGDSRPSPQPPPQLPRGTFQVFVENLKGKSIVIEIGPDDTVEHLRLLIRERCWIPPSEQCLSCGGRILREGTRLREYGIGHGSVIRFWARIRGGSSAPPQPRTSSSSQGHPHGGSSLVDSLSSALWGEDMSEASSLAARALLREASAEALPFLRDGAALEFVDTPPRCGNFVGHDLSRKATSAHRVVSINLASRAKMMDPHAQGNWLGEYLSDMGVDTCLASECGFGTDAHLRSFVRGLSEHGFTAVGNVQRHGGALVAYKLGTLASNPKLISVGGEGRAAFVTITSEWTSRREDGAPSTDRQI